MNIEQTRQNMTLQRVILMRRLRKQGLSYADIGTQMGGVTRQRVHQLLTGYKSRQPVTRKRQAGQRYHQKIKKIVLMHYGNGKLACLKCGFDDIRALSIDHINGGGNAERRKYGSFSYNWLRTNKFPPGYQTLCMNCQWIKRHENNEIKGRLEYLT